MREQKQLAGRLIEVGGSGEKQLTCILPSHPEAILWLFFKSLFYREPIEQIKGLRTLHISYCSMKKIVLAIHVLKGLVHYR